MKHIQVGDYTNQNQSPISLKLSIDGKRQIFCENIQGIWKYEKRNPITKRRTSIFLKIESCDPGNPGGRMNYDDQDGDWISSAMSEEKQVITIKPGNNGSIIFKVSNPFNRNSISLERLDRNGRDGTGEIYVKQ